MDNLWTMDAPVVDFNWEKGNKNEAARQLCVETGHGTNC